MVLGQRYAFRPPVVDASIERFDLFDEPVRLAAPAGRFAAGPLAVEALRDEGWVIGRAGTWCEQVVLARRCL